MRTLLLLAASLVLSGCLELNGTDSASQTDATQAQAPAKAANAAMVVPAAATGGDCYTVDLFTPQKVKKPAKDVPPEYARFLGHWRGGAWNDVWCHELLVYNVDKDGKADLVEMHAPYEPWNQPASAFGRVGRIDKNGNLIFSQGVERTTYKIEHGYMVGVRSGLYGNLKITLHQGNLPPIPRKKPVRMAHAAKATSGS